MLTNDQTEIINCTQFQTLTKKLVSLPLWVKQAVYSVLRSDIKELSDLELLDKIEGNLIQLYKPKSTAAGNKILNNNDRFNNIEDLEADHRQFLEDTNFNITLLEISHKNTWSFKYCCKLFLDLVEKEFVENITHKKSLDLIMYITDKIKIGDFLVRTNRLSTNQLDRALFSQKCSKEIGEDISFNDIIVNMGYMDKQAINNITFIKESSSKVVNIIDESEAQLSELTMFQDELDALSFKNKKLEAELAFYKKELETKTNENLELNKQLTKYSKGFIGKFFTA